METFVVAYSVVWLALVFYVARLGMRQRQLIRAVNALQSQIEGPLSMSSSSDPRWLPDRHPEPPKRGPRHGIHPATSP